MPAKVMPWRLQTQILLQTVVEAAQDFTPDLELQIESDTCLILKPQQHVRNGLCVQIAYFGHCVVVKLRYKSLGFWTPRNVVWVIGVAS